MKRFVFLSFAFLGWAFYELSGGADFQPRVMAVELAAENAVAAPTAQSSPVSPVRAASLVASPAIAPVTKAPVKPDPADIAAAQSDTESVAQLDQIRTSLNQGLSLFADTDASARPLVLASLEQGVAGISAAPAVASDTSEVAPAAWAPEPADIREITATRVNMRDGPGTTFAVITRLTLGHEVEVLGDSGNGWLRLRTLPEERVGWISASLVSKAGRGQ